LKRKVSNIDILSLISRPQWPFNLSIEEAKILMSKLGPRYSLKKPFLDNTSVRGNRLVQKRSRMAQYLPQFVIMGLNVLSIQFFKDNFVKNSRALPILRNTFLFVVFCCLCWLNIKIYSGIISNNQLACLKLLKNPG